VTVRQSGERTTKGALCAASLLKGNRAVLSTTVSLACCAASFDCRRKANSALCAAALACSAASFVCSAASMASTSAASAASFDPTSSLHTYRKSLTHKAQIDSNNIYIKTQYILHEGVTQTRGYFRALRTVRETTSIELLLSKHNRLINI
jgi:hypothetical protein